MAEPQKKSGITRVEKFIYIVLVLLGGAAVMLADLQAEKKKFLNYSDLVYQEVSQRLLASEGVVNALAQFGKHSQIDGEEQDNVLDGLALTYPHIHAIAKFDYVRHRDRLSYEKDMRESPGGITEIREYDNQSGVIRARKRTAYLVAHVVTPLEPANAQLLGLNLLNDDEIGQAVANSMENRTMSIARVPEYLSLQPTLIMLKNTYFGRLQPRTTSEGKRQINGAVMLFLNIDTMIARVSEKFPEIGIDLQVLGFNLTDPAQSEVSPAHSSTTKVAPTTVSYSDTRHFNVGNRDLSLKIFSQYKPGIIQMIIAAVVMLLIAFATRLWTNVRKQQLVAAEKQEEAFQALYSERERAEVTLSSIGDAVITTDDRNHVTFLNPVAETLTGTTNDRAFGKSINQVIQLVDEENDETISDPLEHCARRASENPDITTHLLQQVNGEEALSVDISCSKLKDIQGEEIGSVIVIRDVSHERELKKQLTYQASHDPLTGLVNRTRFEEDVREAISSCDESGIGHALCYMDLDQFKIVNDTCGHMAGDALLKQLSQILSKRVRDSDVLARLGGDEFGLLLRNCDLENAVPIADTLRLAVRQFIFRWDERAFDVRISIGVVAITDPNSSHAELMSAADVACYIAKETGRDYVHAYQPEDESVTQHHELMQWSQKIHDALRTDKFYLMLQSMTPLLSAQADIQIQEFLLRIKMEDGSIVTPATFIPAAERYGLMRDIDMWVIDHTLQIIRDVAKDTDASITYLYSINLSGQSVGDPEVSDYIINKIEEYGIDPMQLMLEITETAAITNFQTAVDFIDRLSEIGCRFALDDFGAGLSSFGYLKRMKVDFIKIDGQFVKGMASDPIDRMMVNNITHLAYGLGLFVIAESVEDEILMEMLRDIGVHFAQGFHVQRPTTIEDWKKENLLKTIFMRTVH